ncbi:MAG: polysaccharide export outer membrane protein [Lentisphaeria bacterium]|jgi:polysaccharide export outer membrane protein
MKTFIGGIFAILLLAGCASTGMSTGQPVVSKQSLLGEYYVGVGDELRVSVWKNEELTMNVPVRPDGKISLPLVGDINAQGLTAKQLAVNLTDSLQTYLRSPQVTVIVIDAGSVDYLLRVRVTGAVNNPVSLPHKDGMTVLDLVLEAGGPTQYASANSARLYRNVGDELKVYPIKLGDILNKGKLSTNYTLAPSDIVTIPERVF